jgi:hypothetical protein
MRHLLLAAATALTLSGAALAAPALPAAPTGHASKAAPAAAKTIPAAAKTAPAKPAATSIKSTPSAKPTPAMAVHKTAATSGAEVTTTTKTGKSVTYDCAKAGNANKRACQTHS